MRNRKRHGFWTPSAGIERAVKADDLVRFAQRAEALGLYCFTIADHVIVPRDISVPYPYTVDGKYPGTGYHLETLATMGFLAGATKTNQIYYQRDDRAVSQSDHHR